jgi:K(+)-stimulated pyrophosphate-energized sodium pump
MEELIIYAPLVLAALGFAFMLTKKSWVMKQDAGTAR